MDGSAEPPRFRGARWYRAALQVNPYAYVRDNRSAEPHTDEASHNAALVAECRRLNVEIVGLADHWRVQESRTLHDALAAAGITVFPGFEAASREGVHVLVLFDTPTSYDHLEHVISACGVHPAQRGRSDPGDLPFDELVTLVSTEQALAIPLGVDEECGGLLRKLSGQSRVAAWRHEKLLAAALSKPDPYRDLRPIIENRDPQYRREHRLAIVSACDVHGPIELAKDAATTWFRMGRPSLAGLLDALTVPDTRVRRNEPEPPAGVRIVSVSWTGGFLDGVALPVNDELTTLIGGRGSGKSTTIEGLRLVLGCPALTDTVRQSNAQRTRDPRNLGPGTIVEVTVEFGEHRRTAVIQWTPDGPRRLRTADGGPTPSLAELLGPDVEFYGYDELAEVAKDETKRWELLQRFIPDGRARGAGIPELVRQLEANRRRLDELDRRLADAAAEDAELDELGTALAALDSTGVTARMAVQARIDRELNLLATAKGRLDGLTRQLDTLDPSLDTSFSVGVSDGEVYHADLPMEVTELLRRVESEVGRSLQGAGEVLAARRARLAELRRRAERAQRETEAEQHSAAVELQRQGHNVATIRSQRARYQQLVDAAPLRQALAQERDDLLHRRRELIVRFAEAQREQHSALERAAWRITGLVGEQVQAVVRDEPTECVIADRIAALPGRTGELAGLVRRNPPSPGEFVEAVRSGGLGSMFPAAPIAQVSLVLAQGEPFLRGLEEIETRPRVDFQINIAPPGEPELWRSTEQASSGQAATTLLLVLLTRTKGLLVIDQPENDLDNQFIFDAVVPRLRTVKATRQLILATHNPNIPVLGDADLIVALGTEYREARVYGRILPGGAGSLDEQRVHDYVEQILEGGAKAFEERRRRYGY